MTTTPAPERRPTPLDRNDTNRVLREVWAERARQDAAYGEQNHPQIHAAGAGTSVLSPDLATAHYGIPHAQHAVDTRRRRAESGNLAWADILVQELAEHITACAEGGDAELVRTSLIRLAAASVAAVQALDRNLGAVFDIAQGHWRCVARFVGDNGRPVGKPQQNARVVWYRHGVKVSEYLYPAYKVWNISAHLADIIAEMERELTDLAVRAGGVVVTAEHQAAQSDPDD